MDCSAPNSSYDRVVWTPLHGLRFVWNLCTWMGNFMQLSRQRRREYLRWKIRTLRKRLGLGISGRSGSLATVEALGASLARHSTDVCSNLCVLCALCG
ncbi:MAG: hypothetical protein FJ398_19350 [Verrucomicrobia bacterium]|nr:hypothetical protein [Verrucomicrobiota bacterium]